MNLPRFSAAVLCVAVALSSVSAGVRVTGSTSKRLTVTWELSQYTVHAVSGPSTIVSFSEQNFDLGDAGTPKLPAFSFYVGVPSHGSVKASFISHTVEERPLVSPVALWDGRKGESGGAEPEFVNPWLSQPRYRRMKGLRVAQFVIRPFLYDAAGGKVRVLRKGSCTIEFPSATRYPSRPVRSEYERMLSSLVLNYDIAAGWIAPRALGKAAAAGPGPLSSGSMVEFTIGDGHGGVAEATTDENGMKRITGGTVLLAGGPVRTANVRLLGSWKGEMPDTASANIPDGFVEIPLIRVDQDGDGYVDTSDYFLAYVTGSTDWTYSPAGAQRDFVLSLDRYDDYRRYWIVTGSAGTELGTFDEPSAAGDTVSTFTDRLCYKNPERLPSSWEGGVDRVWKKLMPSTPAFSLAVTVVNPDTSADGYLRFSGVAPPSSVAPTARVKMALSDGTQVCETCTPGSWETAPGLGGKLSSGQVQFYAQGAGNAFYELSQCEVKYERNLSMSGSAGMAIFSPVDSGLVTYRMSGVPSSTFYLVRIPRDESRMSLVEPRVVSGVATWRDTAGIGVRYYVCTAAGIGTVGDARVVTVGAARSGHVINSLRATTNHANCLIVTDTVFADAAGRLAAHKESYGTFDNPDPAVVYMHAVYREFSGGKTDPAALRNFLAYADRNWQGGLDFVIFLGSGHWDYKHTISEEPLYIPTMQVGAGDSQKCIEDFFACLEPGETWSGDPDIVLGRIPCVTTEDADAVVEKIRSVEDPSLTDYGAWRNRVLLVGDDDMQGRRPDNITDHHLSSEAVGNEILAQSLSVDIRKVYLFEYPWDELLEKPEATRALANEVNNGVSCVNYFGHGDAVLWADEHVLAIDNIGIFHNDPRYPLVSSFSCSVGKFDEPSHDALSDALVKLRGAGAVAAIASTRLAYASSNTSLAKEFYRNLFEIAGRRTLGAAYRQAMTNYSANKQYVLLGDPSIRYVNPVRQVSLSVTDTAGHPLDTLRALQRVVIRGLVETRGASGSTDAAFGTPSSPAYVQIGVYNAPDTAQRKDGGEREAQPYVLPGVPLFVAQCAVRGGVFQQSLRMPLSLSFDKPGPKVTAFAWQGSSDGVGAATVFFHGSDTGSVADSSGPTVSVRPVYTDESRNAGASFADRLTVALPVEIEVALFDENGIDVSGVTPDDGLTMEIPGVLAKQNVNHKFRFSEGDFRSGGATVAFEEDQIAPGRYLLKVGAKDLLGNGTQREFTFEVVAETEFRLGPVFNYPNPMRVGGTTRFFFYTTAPSYQWESDGVRATIRIYSLSGKLVRVLYGGSGGVQNGVEWDGCDQSNYRLGPNIYLYQVTAEYEWGGARKTAKSGICKLVIHPPR